MTTRLQIDEHEFNPVEGGVVEALNEARAWCRDRGRIIVEVRVDEVCLVEEELEPDHLASLDAEIVECASEDSWQLVDESFEQAVSVLDHLGAEQREVACDLDRGERQVAMRRLGEVLQLWSQLRQVVVQGLTLLEIDIDAVDAAATATANATATAVDHEGTRPPSPARAAVDLLRDQLEEIRLAIQSDDWVRLSDCLGYTMDPVVDDWRALFSALRHVIADRRPASAA